MGLLCILNFFNYKVYSLKFQKKISNSYSLSIYPDNEDELNFIIFCLFYSIPNRRIFHNFFIFLLHLILSLLMYHTEIEPYSRKLFEQMKIDNRKKK